MPNRLPIRSRITLVLAGPTSVWLVLGGLVVFLGTVAWFSGGAR